MKIKLQKIFSSLLVLLLIVSITLPTSIYASQITIDTKTDFDSGTLDATLDSSFSSGDIRLKYENATSTDTTTNDFNLGSTNENVSTSQVMTDKVDIGKSYNYNSSNYPGLSNNSVHNSSFIDDVHHLIYFGTYSGLFVINTQNTIDPSDDTLVTTYNATSNPSIGSFGDSRHAFLDSVNHLLYVSNRNGLSVINTQNTIDSSDDTLVTRYNTTSTPALTSDYVRSAFLDSAHHLLYLSGDYGLNVVNTQGTIDPSDDTLVTRYSNDSTPAIPSGNIMQSFLDNTNNLLYISMYNAGVSVINTQGTVDPSDDTFVKTYNTSSTPAIADNYIVYMFIDSTSNLFYLCTLSGLSVINTQGTVDPNDDVLVKTYNTSSTPALVTRFTQSISFDPVTHFMYISNSNNISVINNQGTITPNDDVLVTTYNSSLDPARIGYNSSFIDQINHLLYISGIGLSVVNLLDIYNNQGTYTKTVFGEADSGLWTNKQVLPAVRMSSGSGVINGKAYIAGGTASGGGASLNSLFSYDFVGNTWQTLTSMTTARSTPISGIINDKLYVVGGKGPSGALKTMEIYDPVLNTWSAGPSMVKTRIGAAGGVYNGKLYVVGGTSEECGSVSETSLEVYDPVLNTWSYKASAPITKLVSASASFINGKMYVAGGQVNCSGGDSNALLSYDINTDTWNTDLAHMPSSRTGGSTTVLNNKFVYIGGSNSSYVSTQDVYSYDPTTNAWSILNRLPAELTRSMPFVYDDNLYVIGGKDINFNPVNTNYLLESSYLSDTYQKEKYNNLTWTATTPSGTSITMYYSTDGGNSYTNLGSNPGSYNIDTASSYDLKYKAVLQTNNTAITPSLDSVVVSYAEENNGYYVDNTGTYISNVIDFGNNVSFNSLAVDSTVPTGTTITYSTRSGATATVDSTWSDWYDATDSIVSPSNRYIQIKAILTTTNTSTPAIHSISVIYSTSRSSSGSTVSARYNYLIANNNQQEADKLKIQYPNQITDPKKEISTKTLSFSTDRVLKEKSKGNDVKDLQTYLNSKGYDCGKADGIFGKKTKQALVSFQIKNKLKADGVVGPKTKSLIK